VPSASVISDSNTSAEYDTKTKPVAKGDIEQLAAKVETLRYQLEAAEDELDIAQEVLANELDRQDAYMSGFIDKEKEPYENQILINSMRKQTEKMLSDEYGALFERLGLSDEEIQNFKTLMVNYRMRSREDSLDLMDQSLPEEERNEILQLLEDQQAEFKKQAKEQLGADNYEAYDAYVERLRERQFVHGSTLSADLGLSDEKAQELIDAMYEARKEVETEHGIEMPDFAQPYSTNQGQMVDMDLPIDIYNGYIDSGRRVLSESQSTQFESIINETIEWLKVYNLPLEQL
jgi:hypothetical protein